MTGVTVDIVGVTKDQTLIEVINKVADVFVTAMEACGQDKDPKLAFRAFGAAMCLVARDIDSGHAQTVLDSAAFAVETVDAEEPKRAPGECFMICLLVSAHPKPPTATIQSDCCKCKQPVWLADSSAALIKRKAKEGKERLVPVCEPCAKKCGVKPSEFEFKPEPEQLGELFRNYMEGDN